MHDTHGMAKIEIPARSEHELLRICQAEELARSAHAGMCRPNRARQPCVEHLAEVAALVMEAGGSVEAVTAAWLHDIVEDTVITLAEIRQRFGEAVCELVDGLTDPPRSAELPLGQRKLAQARRLASRCRQTRLVKLADQYSNVRSVLSDPPLDWDEAKCREYVQGAVGIARVCGGVAPWLDRRFERLLVEGGYRGR